MWSLKGKHLSPLYVLHEQPSNALSEPSGPDRDFPVSQQQGHVGGADGAQILVCHHLPSASPPHPQIHEGPSGARAAATEGPSFLPLPKSLPGPLPVLHQFAFASSSSQNQGICAPGSLPPPSTPFLLGFLFPQACSVSALPSCCFRKKQKPMLPP